jgi:multiple sugar transport system permease protein
VLSTLSYTVGFQNMDLARAVAIAVLSIPPLVLLINYVTRRALKDQE